ncbi:MAG: tRNA (guanosine(37)-N1)-methyltransferase TrmD [bacterium]|nr:tRNA (guanosine(37)-N1)-methyltransferase TrmD [bacterium]
MLSIDLLTIFPSFFDSPLKVGLLQKAIASGRLSVTLHDLRSFTTDRHRRVDDLVYGGGAGMVMKPEPIVAAIETICRGAVSAPGQGNPAPTRKVRRILLSPQGTIFSQEKAKQLCRYDQLIFLCGRYEGVDERVIEGGWIDEEISIGDYILMGGEAAAVVILEAVSRHLPGVGGDEDSVDSDTFSEKAGRGLKQPQYTRPELFRGLKVPEILLSGDHKKIEAWRRKEAKKRTQTRRPDLAKGLLQTVKKGLRDD